jgi:hypothetical protein
MIRRMFAAILAVSCCAAHAHLNHVQFAAVDEASGNLRVRYRMSADMFMTNLDVEIKAGRLTESVRQLPVNEIIALYFKTHLLLERNGSRASAAAVAFTLDDKSGDWLADFTFPAPAPGESAALFCDAFLQNNPRTQTLVTLDWRGSRDVFHFRKDNERCALVAASPRRESRLVEQLPASVRFIDGVAAALRSYGWLLMLAIGASLVRLTVREYRRQVEEMLLLFVTVCAMAASRQELIPYQAGLLLGGVAAVFTLRKLIVETVAAGD